MKKPPDASFRKTTPVAMGPGARHSFQKVTKIQVRLVWDALNLARCRRAGVRSIVTDLSQKQACHVARLLSFRNLSAKRRIDGLACFHGRCANLNRTGLEPFRYLTLEVYGQ